MHSHNLKRPVLSFQAVLNAQQEGTLNYVTLKRLLRALRASKAPYPSLHNYHATPLNSQLSHPSLTPSSSKHPTSRDFAGPSDYDNACEDNPGYSSLLNKHLQPCSESIVNGRKNGGSLKENARHVASTQSDEQSDLSVSSRLRRRRRHSRRPLARHLRDLSVQLFSPKGENRSRHSSQTIRSPNSTDSERIIDVGSPGADETHYPLSLKQRTAQAGDSVIDDTIGNENAADSRHSILKPCTPQDILARTGIEVNNVLVKLTIRCAQGDFVRWGQLKNVLTKQKKFQRFCQYVDTLFDAEEILASGSSFKDGESVNPCVYYSDYFWEKAWRESTR